MAAVDTLFKSRQRLRHREGAGVGFLPVNLWLLLCTEDAMDDLKHCSRCGSDVDLTCAVILLDNQQCNVLCRNCIDDGNRPETVDTVWGKVVVGGEG